MSELTISDTGLCLKLLYERLREIDIERPKILNAIWEFETYKEKLMLEEKLKGFPDWLGDKLISVSVQLNGNLQPTEPMTATPEIAWEQGYFKCLFDVAERLGIPSPIAFPQKD